MTFGPVDGDVVITKKNDFLDVISGDLDTVGSEICIKDECFNIISSTDEKVILLAKYNLYVGGKYVSSWTAYGDEATGIQDSSMLGWRSSGVPYNGTVAFSTKDYWSSSIKVYPAYVYNSNSSTYTDVDNYKKYIEIQGVVVEEACLIKVEELEALGCSRSKYSCKSGSSWIYTTSYWTGSANGSGAVWRVNTAGDLGCPSYSYNHYSGVRPVIEVSRQ